MALTNEQIRRLASGSTAKARGDIFSGGTFSDILDALGVAQSAVTGALDPRQTIGEAVRTRSTPGSALGLKGKSRFVLDVLADPLNFVGVGGLTKAGKAAQATGKGARTLGGAARAGERALLTGPGGATIIKGQGVLEALTKGAERVKQVPGVSRALEAVGAVGATGGRTIPEIEQGVRAVKEVKNLKNVARGVQAEKQAQGVGRALRIQRKAEELVNSGRVTAKQFEDITEVIANPKAAVKIAPELRSIADELAAEFKQLSAEFTRITGTKLDSKVVKNVLSRAGRDALKQGKPFKGQLREVAGRAGSEQFATKVGFKPLAGGEIQFGELAGKTKAQIGTGPRRQVLTRLDDGQTYATTRMANQIDLLRAQAKAAGKTDAQLAAELQALRTTNPGEFYTRTALSPRQTNKALKELGSPTQFTENPAEILAAQGADVAKLQSREQFVNGLRSKVQQGSIPGQVVTGTPPAGFSKSKIPGLEDVAFPDTLTPHLDRTYKAFSGIDDVNDFVKLYDRVLNFWKGTATFINPSFHSRNAVSNHWQLFLAGVDNPLAHLRGYRVGRAISRAAKEGADDLTKYVPKKLRKYADEFLNDQGLRSTGAFSVDITGDVATLQDNLLFNKAGAMGEFLENGAKLSLYIQRRLKGFTPEAAGADVRKFLFDYGDLTEFERNVLKRVFPFYTWTRNNIPLQVAMLIQKPTRFSVINKAKASIESTQDGKELDERYLPEWLREAYPIYVGRGASGLQRYVKLEGFLPSVDLNKLGRPGEVPFEQLSPIIKTPMELVSNYDFFYERQIQEFEGQRKFVGLVPGTSVGVNVPAKLEKALSTFRPLNELQKFTVDPTQRVQPTFKERVVNFGLGKTSQLDPQRQRQIFDYLQGKAVANAESDLKLAVQRGNQGEAARLRALIQQLKKGEGFNL